MIDMADDIVILKVHDETLSFKILREMYYSYEIKACNGIKILDSIIEEGIRNQAPPLPYESMVMISKKRVLEKIGESDMKKL